MKLAITLDSVLSRGESTTALSTPVVPSLDAILEQERYSQYPSTGIFARGSGSFQYKNPLCLLFHFLQFLSLSLITQLNILICLTGNSLFPPFPSFFLLRASNVSLNHKSAQSACSNLLYELLSAMLFTVYAKP